MNTSLGHTVSLVAEYRKTRYESERFQIVTMKSQRDPSTIPDEVRPGEIYPEFCVKGYFSRPDFQGQTFELTGEWRYDKVRKEYAFSADFVIPALPTTEEGCEQFIRKNVRGVGKKTAHKIISVYGSDLIAATSDPEVLAGRIKGLSLSKAMELSRMVEAMSSVAQITRLLKNLVDGETIRKIALAYGDEAVKMVKESPYLMAMTIGFSNSDRVGKAMGWKCDADERIAAALECAFYSLRAQTSSIILNKLMLFNATSKTLNIGTSGPTVSNQRIEEVFKQLCESHKFYATPGKKTFVYLFEDYQMEVLLAKEIVKYNSSKCSPENRSKYLRCYGNWVKNHPNIKLAPEQSLAVQTVADHKISVVTGGPGTGKTTVLQAVMETYKKAFPKSPITLMAPTGLASKRMSDSCGLRANTIHKTVGLVPAQNPSGFAVAQAIKIPGGLVIVDEYSMVGFHLTSFLFSQTDLREDTRIVIVGDIDQLPSVSPGAVLDDMIRCGQIPVTRLTYNFRQAQGSNIATVAYAVNNGDISQVKFGGDCLFEAIPATNIIQETERILDTIKRKFLEGVKKYGLEQTYVLSPTHHIRTKDEKELYKYALSTDNLNLVLQELVNPLDADKAFVKCGTITLRVGDRVMNTKNTEECINGDIGFIKSISKEDNVTSVMVEFGDGVLVEYTADKIKNLDLAYAITIHKSQGCEFKYIIMPASMTQESMLQRKLLYTAITRAKILFEAVGNMEAIRQAVRFTPPTQYKELLGLRIVRYTEKVSIQSQ